MYTRDSCYFQVILCTSLKWLKVQWWWIFANSFIFVFLYSYPFTHIMHYDVMLVFYEHYVSY